MSLKHEKIYTLEDGSKLKVIAFMRVDSYGMDEASWSFGIYSCAKGKRIWVNSINTESFSFKQMSMDERNALVKTEAIQIAGVVRLQEVADELLGLLKFKPDEFLKSSDTPS